jgi:osmotically-inducible protein OsmY
MQRSDQVIQATVSDELLFTPSVGTHLAVEVQNGVVTLAGDIASVPERVAARKAAERVWGVKGVVDQMIVRSAGATGANDAEIARSATIILEWSIDVPVNSVVAEVHDHAITLTGAVMWDFQREAATRAVSYMRGITAVSNKIMLTEQPAVLVVKAGVEAAIRRNNPLDADAIAIDIDGHKLTLIGSVRSSTERRQAERVAWSVAGVTAVENKLIIIS